MSLKARLDSVRHRIAAACRRCGRQPSSVTLVGVTKGVPPGLISEAVAAGLTDLGENRVQEARAKLQATGYKLQASGFGLPLGACSLQPVRWHLIGHLQRNKAKHAVELFDVIHSVDSLELIEELERQAAGRRLHAAGAGEARPLEVLVQVNVSGEKTKYGCTPQEASTLVQAVSQRRHLKIAGLMTMAPFSENPEDARPHFRRLRQIRDEVVVACRLQPAACSLSMGMSQDFEVAIEEGADIVRIGTAIFGRRDEQSLEFGVRSSE